MFGWSSHESDNSSNFILIDPWIRSTVSRRHEKRYNYFHPICHCMCYLEFSSTIRTMAGKVLDNPSRSRGTAGVMGCIQACYRVTSAFGIDRHDQGTDTFFFFRLHGSKADFFHNSHAILHFSIPMVQKFLAPSNVSAPLETTSMLDKA